MRASSQLLCNTAYVPLHTAPGSICTALLAGWKQFDRDVTVTDVFNTSRESSCKPPLLTLRGMAMQGDVKKVTDDVAALRPSIFAAVPRVLDRMKSGIEAKIKRQPGWKQGMFRAAYNLKRLMRRLGRFDFVSSHPAFGFSH